MADLLICLGICSVVFFIYFYIGSIVMTLVFRIIDPDDPLYMVTFIWPLMCIVGVTEKISEKTIKVIIKRMTNFNKKRLEKKRRRKMLESKYVKKLTCDACGFSKEVYCDENNTSALSENAIDWMHVRFDRLDTMDYTYKHLCPKCAEKFLALFEKEEVEEKKETKTYRICNYCCYFNRYMNSNMGFCTHRNEDVNAKRTCDNFRAFLKKKDVDETIKQCKNCYNFIFHYDASCKYCSLHCINVKEDESCDGFAAK